MDELVDASSKMSEHGHDVGEEIITYVNLKKNRKRSWRGCSLSTYSVFHLLGQDKFAYAGLIFGLSQFILLLQLYQKMELTSEMVQSDSKIIMKNY